MLSPLTLLILCLHVFNKKLRPDDLNNSKTAFRSEAKDEEKRREKLIHVFKIPTLL